MQIAQSSQFCVPSLFKNRFDLREGKFNMKYYRPVIFLLEHDIMKVLPSFQSPNSETTSNSGWTSITHPSGGKLTLDGTFRLIHGASCVPPRVFSPNAIRRVSGGVQISPQTKRLKFRVAFINDISGHSKLSRNSPSGGKLRAASFAREADPRIPSQRTVVPTSPQDCRTLRHAAWDRQHCTIMYVRVPGIPRADVFFMLLRESMSGQELSRKRAIAKKVWQDLLDVCVCVCDRCLNKLLLN